MRRSYFLAAVLLLCATTQSQATGLDITTEYRLRGLSYSNLNLGTPVNNRSFLSQSMRLGMAFNDILLGDTRGAVETVDIVLRLRALGVTGSTAPIAAPFDRIAAQYPSADFTPFIEHAYLKTHNLGGLPWELRIGRQPFTLGSGLLLDDNGAGLSGLSARAALPWSFNAEAFVFQAQTRNVAFPPGNLDVFGFTVDMPGEGSWQLNELWERDRADQFVAVNGCRTQGPNGCFVSRASRWFSSLRYQLNIGPMKFDGEAAIQKGSASPAGPNPIGNHVTFNGNAQVVRAKWAQTFFTSKETGRSYRGIARLSVARGTGDNPATQTTDEAFFPSHGLRYDGLERSGFGDYFGATPYDGFGGQSTATVSGLARGASGVIAVGGGATPPAWRDIVMDLDYYVFQAERASGTARTLGTETDIRFRYDYQERLQLRLSIAAFTAGPAANPTKPSGRLYKLEAIGRF